MHRVSAEAACQALAGLGLPPGVDMDVLWSAADLVDENIGDEPVAPLAPRIAVRAAQRKLPVGLVAALDVQLRAQAADDRLDEVLDEVDKVRDEVGSPPLAAPIGQIVASQALLNVLTANRYSTMVDELRDLVKGRFGRTPAEVDPSLRRAVDLFQNGTDEPEPVDLDQLRKEAQGIAASEEELLLLALFGEEAEHLLKSIRERAAGDDASLAAGGVDRARAERIREVVRIVQETGVGEITIEEEGTRVSVRRTPEPTYAQPPSAVLPAETDLAPAPAPPRDDGLVRVESPMVGTFYRAPAPGAPVFVEEGDAVAAGQTLCILEAMKLMNEVKAEIEAIVRSISVGNGEPVEYGQLLFELEPVSGPPML
jgi:oxaloacetate decarboxylase alpha subunit